MQTQMISSNLPKTKEDIEITRGGSYPAVDGIRNILSIPVKIIMLDGSINSGNISEKTIEKVKDYLHEHGLHDVWVSVNEYNPKKILQKAVLRPNASSLSMYFGVMTAFQHAVLIPRLSGFMGDHYNPFSNSIHLYSDNASIALHEAGHAKDFNAQPFPTLYALAKTLPGIGPCVLLYQEAQASKNALAHLHAKGDIEGLKEAFKGLSPAFTTHLLTCLGFGLYSHLSYWLAIMGLGHLFGRFLASGVREIKEDQVPTATAPQQAKVEEMSIQVEEKPQAKPSIETPIKQVEEAPIQQMKEKTLDERPKEELLPLVKIEEPTQTPAPAA